jgi:aminoglycoside 3-N-acetyltransferase
MNKLLMKDLATSLASLGLLHGDTVLIHSDLSRVGPVHGISERDGILEAYYQALRGVIGEEGTVVALSCTESYARTGQPFTYETSPSEQGVFSEYLRCKAGSIRSMHPLFSVTALGSRSGEICRDASRSAFGYDSPFDRLFRMDGKILCIGVTLHYMTFVHYVEQRYGVPYSFTKEWTYPVYRDGKPDQSRYFAFVRYLDSGIEYDFSRLIGDLEKDGAVLSARAGLSSCHLVRCSDVFTTAMNGLHKDIFYLLKCCPEKEPWKCNRNPGDIA